MDNLKDTPSTKSMKGTFAAILEEEELLTTKQTARLMRVSLRVLRYWTAQKTIPYIRIGRMIRFRKRDVLEFIDMHIVGGTARDRNSSPHCE